MARYLFQLAVAAAAAIAIVFPEGVAVSARSAVVAAPVGVPLGVYDPGKAFRKASDIGVEHIFVFWQALDRRKIRTTARYALTHKREMMITVEPYTKAPNWTDGAKALFKRVLAGRYDREITAVCAEIKSVDGRPMVRWGHEMEVVTGRYPWARKDAAGYVSAYRYFVRKCRPIAPNARYVWSPMGHKNLGEYYPGDTYVDLIGLPIWGLQEWDHHFYGRDRSFAEVLREKYDRVAEHKKPVVIAELGVAGSWAYRRAWFADLSAAGQEFPLLHSIVYFNDKEPAQWPFGFGTPDWRVGPSLFPMHSPGISEASRTAPASSRRRGESSGGSHFEPPRQPRLVTRISSVSTTVQQESGK